MQERAQGCVPIRWDAVCKGESATAWLGGAGFMVVHGADCLLIDPCLYEENGMTELGHTAFYPMPIKPEEVAKDAKVLYTHADYDHIGLKTALHLPETVEFYAPAPCIKELKAAGIAEGRLHLVRPWERFNVGGIVVRTLAADHSWQEMDPEKYGEPYGPEGCVGFDMETPAARMLFTGDTRLCAHHMELSDAYDLVALDASDDPYHLGHENMAKLAKKLRRAALLPCHFGTYDAPEAVPHNGSLQKLKGLLGEDAARVLPDVIGQWVLFKRKGE